MRFPSDQFMPSSKTIRVILCWFRKPTTSVILSWMLTWSQHGAPVISCGFISQCTLGPLSKPHDFITRCKKAQHQICWSSPSSPLDGFKHPAFPRCPLTDERKSSWLKGDERHKERSRVLTNQVSFFTRAETNRSENQTFEWKGQNK